MRHFKPKPHPRMALALEWDPTTSHCLPQRLITSQGQGFTRRDSGFSGIWIVHVYYGSVEIQGSPLQLLVNDPYKAYLSGPDQGTVGNMVAFKGRFKDCCI